MAVYVVLMMVMAMVVANLQSKEKELRSMLNSNGLLPFSLNVLKLYAVLAVLFHLRRTKYPPLQTTTWIRRWRSVALPSPWPLNEILKLSGWLCAMSSRSWLQWFVTKRLWSRLKLPMLRRSVSSSKPQLPIVPHMKRWILLTQWSIVSRYWPTNRLSEKCSFVPNVMQLLKLHVLRLSNLNKRVLVLVLVLYMALLLLVVATVRHPLVVSLGKYLLSLLIYRRYEFWQQIKAFQAQIDDDAMSDAPSEATNDDARVELDTLKKRSIDNALTPEELDKMEKLMQKQSQIKAAK
ncbi:unnamed protein product, partial [Prorocentrum cordatum]